MKKFTILGATGVIGSQLAHRLRACGHLVFSPARDDESVFSAELGHVIYAIGITADFRSKPFETMTAHVGFLSEILKRGNYASLTYLSSTRVYAKASTSNEESILRVSPLDPSDVYNISKIAGEALCLSLSQPYVRIARISNVVGGMDDANSRNFIPTIRREALTGKIIFNTTLTSQKDYIHIDDVIDMLIQISISGQERLYNVASGIQTSHQQWANYFQKTTGCIIEVAPNALEISFPPINNSRIKSEFGFSPRPIFQ